MSIEESKKINIRAKVIENIKLADDTFRIKMDCPEISQYAIPGQFLTILCQNAFLRRPFSIANVSDSFIEIIYKVKGHGTESISLLEPDDEINLLGPFGKGFTIEDKKALLIGAGVGAAPLIFLSKELREKNIPYAFAAGFQSFINIPEINLSENFIITEDGSTKYKGRINEFLDNIIQQVKPQKIYSCGPFPVLKYASDLAAEYDIDIEVALEKDFACGVGVCMGCSVKIKEGNREVNRRICKDGPVFNGEDVVW